MGDWDTPPTEEEIGLTKRARSGPQKRSVATTKGAWSVPPTKEEWSQASVGANIQEKPPEVAPAEAFINASSDALLMGTPIVNAATTLADYAGHHGGVRAKLTPQAEAEARAAGLTISPEPPTLLQSYRSARDDREERLRAGVDQNPTASLAGTGTGIGLSFAIPSLGSGTASSMAPGVLKRTMQVLEPAASAIAAPLPTIKAGAGAARRVLSGALTAAEYGGLNSLIRGQADLANGEIGEAATEVAGLPQLRRAMEQAKQGHYWEAAKDFAGAGILGGFATGGVTGAGIEGARAIAANRIEKAGIGQGRRHLLNGANTLSKRTPVSDESVLEAYQSKALQPFSTTSGTFGRLENAAEEAGQTYANIIEKLEAQGVKGPEAKVLADELMSRGSALERHTMNDALPAEYLLRAQQLEGKAAPQSNLGLRQTENIKQSLQDMAKYGRLEETPLNEVRRDIASTVRAANENAIERAGQAAPEGSEVRQLSRDFVPVKQRTGRLIEAREAARRGAAGSEQRRLFDLTDNLFVAGGLSAGNLPAAATGVAAGLANNFLRNRGTSAVSYYLMDLADALRSGRSSAGVGRYLEQSMTDPADRREEMDQQRAMAEELRRRSR